MTQQTFADRVSAAIADMRPAEQRVVRFFLDNREATLFESAVSLAEKAGTSDATVIRAVKSLGFSGMEEMRRSLADEMRANPSPFNRMERTLNDVGDDLISALDMTIDIHLKALERLRSDVSAENFQSAVHSIVAAKRVTIFGIGPSSAMADYFSMQLKRFGVEATSITQTGILLADQLLDLRQGDLMMIFAYGRIYPELASILDQSARRGVSTVLFSDTLGAILRDQVDLVLPVQRGRTDMLSMHTTTLGLIEALLVGVAKSQPEKTMTSLKSLNELRSQVVGKPMDLPAS
ncbi:MAG: MurR/RpiR family transcriptional regulator [Rhodospirillales bacterium]|nr:MurR/RpiR family transcriptional regulator [Rhodospirillales bacterium]